MEPICKCCKGEGGRGERVSRFRTITTEWVACWRCERAANLRAVRATHTRRPNGP